MALIKCPECGKEISDKAKACPECGYELKQNVEATKQESFFKKNKTKKISSRNGCVAAMIFFCLIL